MSRKLLLSTIVLTALLTGRANGVAQESSSPELEGWTVGPSAFGLLWTITDVGFEKLGGVGLQLGHLKPLGFGFDFRAAYFFPAGRFRAAGVSAILGTAYGLPAGPALFQLKAGAAGLVGGDNDGTPVVTAGPYVGVGLVGRVTGRLGVQGDVLARFYVTSGDPAFAPSAAIGLLLLPG